MITIYDLLSSKTLLGSWSVKTKRDWAGVEDEALHFIGGPTLRVAVKWVKAYNTTRRDAMRYRCDNRRDANIDAMNAMECDGDTSINSIFTNFLSRNIYKYTTVY